MIERIKDEINKKYKNNQSRLNELNYKLKICDKNTRFARINRFALTNILMFCACPFISFFATTTPFISIPVFYIGTFIIHSIKERILDYKGKLRRFSSARTYFEIKEERNKRLLQKLNIEADNKVNKKILDTIDNKKIDTNINKNTVLYKYDDNKRKLDNFYETVNEKNKNFIYTLHEHEKGVRSRKNLIKLESIYTAALHAAIYPVAVFIGAKYGVVPFLIAEGFVEGTILDISDKLDKQDAFLNNRIKTIFSSKNKEDKSAIIDNSLIDEAVENKIGLESAKIIKKDLEKEQEKKNIRQTNYYNYHHENINSKHKTLVKSLYRR